MVYVCGKRKLIRKNKESEWIYNSNKEINKELIKEKDLIS